MYAGFAGAGSIVPVVLPLAGGWFITRFGFNVFFLLFAVISLLSLMFIKRIDCRR